MPKTALDLFNPFLQTGKAEDKEKQLKFERLSEIFTWVAIVISLLVLQLPFSGSFNKQVAYGLIIGVGVASFIWYRLIPKRYAGQTKNFVYTFIALLFIAYLVHQAGGLRGFIVIAYFLTALRVGLSMSLLYTFVIIFFIISLIFLEAFTAVGPLSQNLSLAFLHSWGLFITTFFARFNAGQAVMAKQREDEINLEREKAIGKLKDDFVYVISHQLREPAENISKYVNEIFNKYLTTLNSESREILDLAGVNSKRLVKLLDDLMDVSKIESGSLRVQFADVVLKPLVSEVLSTLFFDAKNKRITLTQSGDIELAVKADPDRLKEILINLVGNAIKYTPEGGRVEVNIKNEGDFAKITVSDNGIGISEEDQKHLFEKFYRVENEFTKAVKGSGLGLFITKNLVEKMGGSIGVFSKVGQGTSFYFRIPRYRW